MKVNTFKKLAEEAEQSSMNNMAKYRKAQNQVDQSEERANHAEALLQKSRFDARK